MREISKTKNNKGVKLGRKIKYKLNLNQRNFINIKRVFLSYASLHMLRSSKN